MVSYLDVNQILKEDITKITSSLIPHGFNGDVGSIRRMQDMVSELVDALGKQSAAEQGHRKVMTTAIKLRSAHQQTLYLLRDANARDGKGEVVGMLKMDCKHLFLLDGKEAMREADALCVLDFFVARGWQRRGWGKVLFDHMLQDTHTSAHQLAVDGPSDQMESFLAKKYGVSRLVRQSNNFAISPHFFDSLPPHHLLSKAGTASQRAGRSTAGASMPSQRTAGRYTALQSQSLIANTIHGGGDGGGNGGAGPAQAAHLTKGEGGPGSKRAAGAEEPGSLPALVPAVTTPAPFPAANQKPAGASTRRISQVTDEGLFNKYHHRKLW